MIFPRKKNLPPAPWWQATQKPARGNIVLIALLAGSVGGFLGVTATGASIFNGATLVSSNSVIERAPDSVAGIAQRVLPSVVSISTSSVIGGGTGSIAVGDSVIAIGSPLGLSGTVTTGIISAKDRAVTAGDANTESSYINALQTDAAINPGNSGGPLVDATGAVIGVNSAIASLGINSQIGSIGLGFAIPINQARKTAQQLIENGVATYPVIGVTLDMNFTGTGAKITTTENAILPGSPAQVAGLRAGDVITSFEGKAINGAEELIVAVRAKNVGDRVTLIYKRDGVSKSTTLTLTAAKK